MNSLVERTIRLWEREADELRGRLRGSSTFDDAARPVLMRRMELVQELLTAARRIGAVERGEAITRMLPSRLTRLPVTARAVQASMAAELDTGDTEASAVDGMSLRDMARLIAAKKAGGA